MDVATHTYGGVGPSNKGSSSSGGGNNGIMVVEKEEILAREEETKVDVETEGGLQGNNKRSCLIPPLTKEGLRILSVRYARNLATLLLHVGLGLRKQGHQIHLDKDQPSPKEETEVHTGQAMVHEVDKEEGSPQ